MVKAMRIAMLGHKTVPSRSGGVEVAVGALAQKMTDKGHTVICYNRTLRSTDAETGANSGFRTKNVLTLAKNGLSAVSASFSAALCAAVGRYDIVHFHAEGPCAMMWITKLFGKKCIATIHGLDHKRAKWGRFASSYIKFGEKCAVRLADEIIVLSRNAQIYFSETYGRSTAYIPNGAEKPEKQEAREIKERFGLTKDGYILFLGRIVPEKGIKNLIEAFKNLDTDKKLVLAGGSDGSEKFAAEMKQAAKDDERIIFTGFVSGRTLQELYSSAYIYVLPSDVEGMPITLLEALSYGNLCLTSDIPECTEVTGEFGVTFKQGDADDLMEKLGFLCASPETVSEMKKKIETMPLGEYEWDKITDSTLALYERARKKRKK